MRDRLLMFLVEATDFLIAVLAAASVIMFLLIGLMNVARWTIYWVKLVFPDAPIH